jgi:hypothetical protein
MVNQELVDALTRLRLASALYRQRHQIEGNRLREAAIQSIVECRAAIWAAEALLSRTAPDQNDRTRTYARAPAALARRDPTADLGDLDAHSIGD